MAGNNFILVENTPNRNEVASIHSGIQPPGIVIAYESKGVLLIQH